MATLGPHETEFEINRAKQGIGILTARIASLEGVLRKLDFFLYVHNDVSLRSAIRGQTDAMEKEIESIFGSSLHTDAQNAARSIDLLNRCLIISGTQRRQGIERNIVLTKDVLTSGITVLKAKIERLENLDKPREQKADVPGALGTDVSATAKPDASTQKSVLSYFSWQPTLPIIGVKVDVTGIIRHVWGKIRK